MTGKYFVRQIMILSMLVTVVLPLPGWSLVEAIDSSRLSIYSSDDIADIELVFIKAEEAGVNPDLLIPRLEEGLAKRVPATRLIPVLHRELILLTEARELLETHDYGAVILKIPGGWQRTANLLAGGVEEYDVLSIIDSVQHQPDLYRPASALYMSLINWGVESTPALNLLQIMTVSEINPVDYPGIVDILTDARRLRYDIDYVLNSIIDNAPKSTEVQELRRRVLRR
ncbi:hypothetical protein JCM12856_21230 [Spirochaeta dissipatitropha]